MRRWGHHYSRAILASQMSPLLLTYLFTFCRFLLTYSTKCRRSDEVSQLTLEALFDPNDIETTEGLASIETPFKFRRFFQYKNGTRLSPWHDIPLQTEKNNEFWMVTEIPQKTRPKFEIATKEAYNPMAQDVKNKPIA